MDKLKIGSKVRLVDSDEFDGICLEELNITDKKDIPWIDHRMKGSILNIIKVIPNEWHINNKVLDCVVCSFMISEFMPMIQTVPIIFIKEIIKGECNDK